MISAPSCIEKVNIRVFQEADKLLLEKILSATQHLHQKLLQNQPELVCSFRKQIHLNVSVPKSVNAMNDILSAYYTRTPTSPDCVG